MPQWGGPLVSPCPPAGPRPLASPRQACLPPVSTQVSWPTGDFLKYWEVFPCSPFTSNLTDGSTHWKGPFLGGRLPFLCHHHRPCSLQCWQPKFSTKSTHCKLSCLVLPCGRHQVIVEDTGTRLASSVFSRLSRNIHRTHNYVIGSLCIYNIIYTHTFHLLYILCLFYIYAYIYHRTWPYSIVCSIQLYFSVQNSNWENKWCTWLPLNFVLLFYFPIGNGTFWILIIRYSLEMHPHTKELLSLNNSIFYFPFLEICIYFGRLLWAGY